MAYKTGTQLKLWAQSLTESDTISDSNALLWINEFLTSILRGDACLKETQNFNNVTAGQWYGLNSDVEEVFKVEQYGSSSFSDADYSGDYYDYTMDDERIKFDYASYYKLHYFRLPDEIDAIGDEVKIDSVFYLSCATWIAYRHLCNDDEDNAKAQTLGQLRLSEFSTAFVAAKAQRRTKFKIARKIRRV